MQWDLKEKSNIIFQFFSIVILIIVSIYQLYQANKEVTPQAMIIFAIVIGVTILAIITAYITDKYKNLKTELKENREKMEEIDKRLKQEEKLNEFDKRISILEAIKNKKGQTIDPRWIITIILIILLYMYLKSIGVIK